MTAENGYNGWKNYETWAVALWLDNEQAEYETTRSKARAYVAEGDETSTVRFADWLKDYVDETRPELPASLWSDLLNAAFGEVDWYEIAENYMEEVAA